MAIHASIADLFQTAIQWACMSNPIAEIEQLSDALDQALSKAKTAQEVEEIRIQFLGKKGLITKQFQAMKNATVEEKRTLGPALNELKRTAEERVKAAQADVLQRASRAADEKAKYFDVTANRSLAHLGSRHPLSQLVEEIEDIFLSMGFRIFDGPEVEHEDYNFTALNIGPEHPARDMYDTLWLQLPSMLMRTHTSPVQIHAMKNNPLPLAGIAAGRVYRHEAIDASHDFMFMQCEGILIDKGVNLGHLFGTLREFLQKLFNGADLDIRTRPGFFPFVEPGVEIDMRCPFCTEGCSVCKRTRWIEVFPGGLIHPNVLKAADIDPEEYSGFAFGFGLTRLAMLKYGIDDIRLFHCGKMKFLEQF